MISGVRFGSVGAQRAGKHAIGFGSVGAHAESWLAVVWLLEEAGMANKNLAIMLR